MTQTTDRPAFMDAVTVLRRNRTGDVYHRADCRRVKVSTSIPWRWAEGKSRAEVEATHLNGLKPCKVCDPLEVLFVREGWKGCTDSAPDSEWTCFEYDGTGLWCDACKAHVAETARAGVSS